MVVDLLAEARGAPGSIALVSEERTWTFAELDRYVSERADTLRTGGAQVGRVVAISMDATADTVIELLALWRAGATPAPLNARLTGAERDAAVAALTGQSSDAQAVLWTSGTEGRPRGVAISFEGLQASAHASKERLGLGTGDVWLASLSPAHVGGLALITRSLLVGSQLLVVGSFDAARVSELIDGTSLPAGSGRPVTHLSVVPTQLLRLLEVRGDRRPPDSFRCALVGGAHAPTKLVKSALDVGWPLALTYGLTEATSQVATAPPLLTANKPGTVGRPLEGVEVGLGEDGEILVRGATLASGYVGAEAEEVMDTEGWHHTGDFGRMDSDGDLWVTGRRSDRLVTGGVTVDAVEVEEALRSHGSVADACVVGVSDTEWGERVAAWVVPTGEGLNEPELQSFLRDRLSAAKLPRVFHVSNALPRNANGKVDRVAVREALAKAHGQGTDPGK
jgi:O-succinylbenzoic acid--CoA ligase